MEMCGVQPTENLLSACKDIENTLSDTKNLGSVIEVPPELILATYSTGSSMFRDGLTAVASSTSLRILASKAAAKCLPDARDKSSLVRTRSVSYTHLTLPTKLEV